MFLSAKTYNAKQIWLIFEPLTQAFRFAEKNSIWNYHTTILLFNLKVLLCFVLFLILNSDSILFSVEINKHMIIA